MKHLSTTPQPPSPLHPVIPSSCHPFILSSLHLIILSLFLAACGGSDIQAMIPGPAPWNNGEVSTYRIIDLNDAYAGIGTFYIMAGSTLVGPDGWTITREIKAQGEDETVVVQTSAKGVRPKWSMLIRNDGGGRQAVETTYDGSDANLVLTTRRDVVSYERIQVPSDVRDQRTLLLLARSLPLTKGYATRFNSFLPVAGLLDRITLTVKNQQTISVDAGTFDTWYVTLNTTDSQIEAWIGVEAPYPVIKFVEGRSGATFELSDFQSGTE